MTAMTRGIRIDVRTRYVPERSSPPESWFFAYQVTIQNESDEVVALVSREWIITNGNDDVQVVRGAGVVGEQPTMQPGESFQYVSACPLDTPIGTMRGSYQMVTAQGAKFDAQIAMFSLAEPLSVN